MATGTPVPLQIRAASIRQFTATWKDYRTVSAAVADVARDHDLGRSTLQEWLMADDLWPSPRRRVAWLEEENDSLRAQLAQCHCGQRRSSR